MNRRPQKLIDQSPDPLPGELEERLKRLDWVRDAMVRLREEGHLFFGEAFVVPKDENNLLERIEQATREACAVDWRLQDFAVVPVRQLNSGGDTARPSNPATPS